MQPPITLIAGARPNFMKIAPLVKALDARGVARRIVHTGQHYDERMSETFFRELSIPEPDVNLGVGSGTHVAQIAGVMQGLESDFTTHRPAAVVVVGDVNSTLAATIAANKLGIPVAHVEAGLRSGDRTMPEEINRILTDSIADWLFTSEPSGNANLKVEGVAEDRIHHSGNVMIDTQQSHLEAARSREPYRRWELDRCGYAVVTLHRPSNVDNPEHLQSILTALETIAREIPIVFPVHPRTKARLADLGHNAATSAGRWIEIEPLGYIDMLGMVDGARLLLTDSGGLQEETTAIQVPCLTLRENTERPITVTEGSNQLVGWKTDNILEAARKILAGPERIGKVPATWDGHAAERIADILLRTLGIA